jgi:hypothetical protein
MTLFERVHMPSFAGATEWLNSEPLGPAALRGHVVLVNLWTWTWINWLRQEPYVRARSQAYRNDGLVVIGVDTPEFSFEHEMDGVRRATKERAIDYPVALDNDFVIWDAFANHYWPALYFVDADGIIRDHHFGEGRYEQSERVIQRLLGVERALVSVEGLGVEAEADWDNLRTAETDLGYGRSERLASPGGIAFDQRRAYELPEHLPFGHWPSPASGRSGLRMLCSTRPAGASPTGSTRATRISCCLPERRSRSPSACTSTAKLPAPRAGSTSTRTVTAHSRTAACTSSCASTTRSASGPWGSRSSSPPPRRTRSRLASQTVTPGCSRAPTGASRRDRKGRPIAVARRPPVSEGEEQCRGLQA